MRFLFVDRILALNPGQETLGIKHVTPDDAFLCLDERTGKRCFIPALVGETVGQLAAWNVMVSCDFTKRPVAGIAERACVHRPVYVGETLRLETHLERLDDDSVQYHGKAHVGSECVFELDGALGPLLPMDDFIDTDVVRAQFNEIHRPGDWPELNEGQPLDESPRVCSQPVAPWIQFDRVLHHETGVSITAEKRITRAAPYFPDHFPKKPVLPMTILLECLMNLGRTFVKQAFTDETYRVQDMRRIKMNAFLEPGDVVNATLRVKSHQEDTLVLTCRVSRFEKRVCVLELVMVREEQKV
jgi:3-hydroxymyristoyl/3-hydroxydecanoyl-(acyl carrier protein) dehydratase